MPESDKTASSSRTSFRQPQFRWKTDPTFYPTARLAMESPQERYAYVAALTPDNRSRPDSLFVVDVDAGSNSFGKVIGQLGGIARKAPHPNRKLPSTAAANGRIEQRRQAPLFY